MSTLDDPTAPVPKFPTLEELVSRLSEEQLLIYLAKKLGLKIEWGYASSELWWRFNSENSLESLAGSMLLNRYKFRIKVDAKNN